jgi:hypothetical protein
MTDRLCHTSGGDNKNFLPEILCKEEFTMKNIFGTLFGMLLLSAATFAQSNGGGRLAGTWDTVVTIRNCESGAAIRTFLSTGSFNQGGTFSGITSGTPPTARTSERGVWAHVRANLYRFRFKAYLYSPDAIAIGYQIITHDLELDPDNLNYVSGGTTQIFNLDGVQIGSGCSTAVGSRMVLD